jgi:hypothetical protein
MGGSPQHDDSAAGADPQAPHGAAQTRTCSAMPDSPLHPKDATPTE